MKNTTAKLISCILCVLLVLSPAWGIAEKAYRIAVIAPLTGDFAQYGEAYRNAVDLMVNEVNERGGIGGILLDYEIFDDKNEPREDAILAGRIAAEGDYLAVIGPFASTGALACAPILQGAGIIEMCPTSTHPDLTKTGDCIFRGAVTSELEAPLFAQVTLEKLHAQNVGIIYTQDDWGITTYTEYARELEALGGNVVLAESYISGSTRDFTPILTKIASQDIELLFIAAMYNDTAMILEQLRQLGYAGTFAIQGTGSLYTEEFLQLAGDNAEGMYITASFCADSPEENVQAFVSAYRDRYGSEPNLFAASVYDGLGLIVSALESGATDRETLKTALAAISDYEGVTGKASFSETRDVIKDEVILKVEGGAFVYAD